jgi:hypothetical protein
MPLSFAPGREMPMGVQWDSAWSDAINGPS